MPKRHSESVGKQCTWYGGRHERLDNVRSDLMDLISSDLTDLMDGIRHGPGQFYASAHGQRTAKKMMQLYFFPA